MESDGKCAVLSTEGDARISESGRNRREASPDLRGITDGHVTHGSQDAQISIKTTETPNARQQILA